MWVYQPTATIVGKEKIGRVQQGRHGETKFGKMLGGPSLESGLGCK